MPVYAVIEIEILDRELYDEYCLAVPGIIEKYGGRYLANTEKITLLAGDRRPDKMVLLEFDSMQNLLDCFQSDDYRSIVHLREKSTRGRAIVVGEAA